MPESIQIQSSMNCHIQFEKHLVTELVDRSVTQLEEKGTTDVLTHGIQLLLRKQQPFHVTSLIPPASGTLLKRFRNEKCNPHKLPKPQGMYQRRTALE